MASYWAGMGLGLSLILAIGAQNAFVLRQGLRREHVGAVVAICALSDAALIAAGVAGMDALADRLPWVLSVLRWGGVAFLAVYGARAFRSAWRGGEALRAGRDGQVPLRRVVLVCLALTWANPHVYLDTVMLMGSISSQYASPWSFAAGGMTGSVLFFSALGYGARLLAPVFARPAAWRVLDLLVGLIMWAVALSLALRG